MRLGDDVQPGVLILERAHQRDLQGAFQFRRDAEQQRIGRVNQVRFLLALKPFRQSFDFLALISQPALEHGERHRPQRRGVC